ncbi:MAG: MFS transporter [Acidimicrobiia bacterium]
MHNRVRAYLAPRALLTAVVYTGVVTLPLFLVSAQILQLGREVDFGVGRLGLATASFFGMAALTANPAGIVVTRFGPGRGLRIGGFLAVAACVIAATASEWWIILLAMATSGSANGLTQVSANVAIFDGVVESRQGLAFGSKQASVPMAGLVAGISLPLIGLAVGWRWSFVAAGVLALIFAISAPEPATRSSEARIEKRTGRLPRSLFLLAVAGFCAALAGNGVAHFVVPSAVDVGISEGTAGIVLAASSLFVVVIRVGVGWTVDRRRSLGHMEMAALLALGTVGALFLMTTGSIAGYLIAMPLALIGAWGWPGVFFFTVVRSYPDFPARASGFALSTNLTGTVLGPIVVGFLAAAGDYSSAWLFVATAAAAATFAFLLAYRRTVRVKA